MKLPSRLAWTPAKGVKKVGTSRFPVSRWALLGLIALSMQGLAASDDNLVTNGRFDEEPFLTGWRVADPALAGPAEGPKGTGNAVLLTGSGSGLIEQKVPWHQDALFAVDFLFSKASSPTNGGETLQFAVLLNGKESDGALTIAVRDPQDNGVYEIQIGTGENKISIFPDSIEFRNTEGNAAPDFYRLRVVVRAAGDNPTFDVFLGEGAAGKFTSEAIGLTTWHVAPSGIFPNLIELKFHVAPAGESPVAGGFLVGSVSLVPLSAEEAGRKP